MSESHAGHGCKRDTGGGTGESAATAAGVDEGWIDPTLDSCCAKDERERRHVQRVNALVRKTDPVRKAMEARRILDLVPLPGPASACADAASADTRQPHRGDGHQHRGGDDGVSAAGTLDAASDRDSDLDDEDDDDNDEELARIRQKRFEQMGAETGTGAAGDASALPALRAVDAEQLAAALKAHECVVVQFADVDRPQLRDTAIMDGYLRQLAIEHKHSAGRLCFLRCNVSAAAPILSELFLFVVPALAAFRRGTIVNRCVGSFLHVFPEFENSPQSVRSWLARSGMFPPDADAPGDKGGVRLPTTDMDAKTCSTAPHAPHPGCGHD